MVCHPVMRRGLVVRGGGGGGIRYKASALGRAGQAGCDDRGDVGGLLYCIGHWQRGIQRFAGKGKNHVLSWSRFIQESLGSSPAMLKGIRSREYRQSSSYNGVVTVRSYNSTEEKGLTNSAASP